MKFGIDAPWYNDSVERVAFNLYAMEQQSREDEIETAINAVINGETLLINLSFEPTAAEKMYIYDRLAEAGF